MSITTDINNLKVSETYNIHNQLLGISNNFYVKLYNEKDKSNLIKLANFVLLLEAYIKASSYLYILYFDK